jgi:hypothetical protein
MDVNSINVAGMSLPSHVTTASRLELTTASPGPSIQWQGAAPAIGSLELTCLLGRWEFSGRGGQRYRARISSTSGRYVDHKILDRDQADTSDVIDRRQLNFDKKPPGHTGRARVVGAKPYKDRRSVDFLFSIWSLADGQIYL